MSLHQRCKSIKYGNFVLGSKESRHTTTSVIMIQAADPESTCSRAAEIQYFVNVHIAAVRNVTSEVKILLQFQLSYLMFVKFGLAVLGLVLHHLILFLFLCHIF